MGVILKAEGLEISFGSEQVLKNLSFELCENEVLGVIGPNGSGKTVLLDILTGALKPTAGRIIFGGRDISREKTAKRIRSGIGRTFQVPKPFEKMTVLENLMAGACFGAGMAQRQAAEKAAEIAGLTGFSGEKLELPAGKLGLLDRKRLELGRALSTGPKVLLLDEVGGGLTESELESVIQLVKTVKDRGVSVIWIEHIIRTMLEGTDRVMLLANGENVVCGTPHEVMVSGEVSRVYMGVEKE